MRILAVDVGAGTQDILLFDSANTVENCYKMVLPSPTVVVASKIRRATNARKSVLLTGYTMGGGSCARALSEHLKSGLHAYATPLAAATVDDDLDVVREIGVQIVSEDESKALKAVENIEMGDLQLDAIKEVLEIFCTESGFDAIAVAVQDHGAAPSGVSDRVFRFDYLRTAVTEHDDLFGFAYLAEEIPPFMTRMLSVAASLEGGVPILVLDTGPAAAIGALEDTTVADAEDRVIVNIGNGHTFAVRVVQDSIVSLFEHHTHALNSAQIDHLVSELIDGKLTNKEVFDSGGHGCLITRQGDRPGAHPLVAVTGPRRNIMANSATHPYFAVPHGDMMLSGSFGLVRAFARKHEEWREEIEARLAPAR